MNFEEPATPRQQDKSWRGDEGQSWVIQNEGQLSGRNADEEMGRERKNAGGEMEWIGWTCSEAEIEMRKSFDKRFEGLKEVCGVTNVDCISDIWIVISDFHCPLGMHCIQRQWMIGIANLENN